MKDKTIKIWDHIRVNFKFLLSIIGLVVFIWMEIQAPVNANAIQQKEIDQLFQYFREEKDARIASDAKVEGRLDDVVDNQQISNDRIVAIMTKLQVMDPSRVSSNASSNTKI